jgi:hypothetical protein
MTAPQATPACAIGLPGSFTGVSELEVPHAVAGPIAARNDLARCGPLQRQRFWRRRGQPRPDLGLVIRMTGIVAPADKVRLGAAPRGARSRREREQSMNRLQQRLAQLEEALAPKGRHFAILFKDGEPSAQSKADQLAAFKAESGADPSDTIHEVIVTFS